MLHNRKSLLFFFFAGIGSGLTMTAFLITQYFGRFFGLSDISYIALTGMMGTMLGILCFLLYLKIVKFYGDLLLSTLNQVKRGDFSARFNLPENDLSAEVGKALDETLATLESYNYHLNTDPLTQLPNRLALTESFQRLSKNEANALYVLLLDLDHFKDINDIYGHQVGDQVLQSLASRIQTMALPNEEVFRLGGDEFVSLLSLSSTDDIEVYKAKLESLFSKPLRVDGLKFEVSVSIGISQHGVDGENLKSLIESADNRMYDDKFLKHEPSFLRRGLYV